MPLGGKDLSPLTVVGREVCRRSDWTDGDSLVYKDRVFHSARFVLFDVFMKFVGGERFGMIRYLFALIGPLLGPLLGLVQWEADAAAADWKVVPHVLEAHVSAIANQNFGSGQGKENKDLLPAVSSLPQTLQTAASDRDGDDRSASGEAELRAENGLIRFKGVLHAVDSNLNDFLAPVATIKGGIVLLPEGKQSKKLKVSFRLNNEGPPSLVGAGEGKPLPENIVFHIWLNDDSLLQSSDLLAGVDRDISLSVHPGDVLTLLFQTEFTVFSTGEANLVSSLQYAFSEAGD